MAEWPKRYAKMQARAAINRLPPSVKQYYHPEYKISMSSDRDKYDGDFAGLVCNECNTWREYGHEKGCKVIRKEPDYKWKPNVTCTIRRKRGHV